MKYGAATDKSERLMKDALYIVRDKVLIRLGFTFPSDAAPHDIAKLLAARISDLNLYDLDA